MDYINVVTPTPTPTLTPTATPTPTSTPIPTSSPTPTPAPTAECINIKVYDLDSSQELSAANLRDIPLGKRLRFAIEARITDGSDQPQIRYRVNQAAWTKLDQGQNSFIILPPHGGEFTVNAEVCAFNCSDESNWH